MYPSLCFRICDKHEKEKKDPNYKPTWKNCWNKDLLSTYIEKFPQLSSQLEKNTAQDIYIMKPFRGKTFEEMLNLFKKHIEYQSDENIGMDYDRQEAAQANYEIRKLLNEREITSQKMTKFKKYINGHIVHELEEMDWKNDEMFINIGKLTKVKNCR